MLYDPDVPCEGMYVIRKRIQLFAHRATAFLLVVLLLFLQPMMVATSLVQAEESTPSATLSETESPPEESPTPAPSPSPTSTSVLTTGDAAAQSETNTAVNTLQDVQWSENDAEVSGASVSDAESGKNTITEASGSATMHTGDAGATSLLSTAANIVDTNESTPSADATPSGDLHEDSHEPHVEFSGTSNDADVESQTDANANTGTNEVQNAGNSTIVTGDAVAIANALNVVNFTAVGSNFSFLYLDLLDALAGTLDLNAVWRELLLQENLQGLMLSGGPDATESGLIVASVENTATLDNTVAATANTGDNASNGGTDTTIQTGNAYAAANAVNLVNTTVVDSTALFGIINIFGQQSSDIVLPRPEFFSPSGEEDGPLTYLQLDNSAYVLDTTAAYANTGLNTASLLGGSNSIQTGQAIALSNTLMLVNFTLVDGSWYSLIINNLGGWSGNILGWSTPDTTQEATVGSAALTADAPEEESQGGYGGGSSNSNVVFHGENDANVQNTVTASANTGLNTVVQEGGTSVIQTGVAKSVANLVNLVNTTIMQSRFFMSIINIFGEWTGNVVFAYPNLVVGITQDHDQVQTGGTLVYTIHYGNTGNDIARNVYLEITCPEGFEVGDPSVAPASHEGQHLAWNIGSLQPGEEGSIDIPVHIPEDYEFSSPQAAGFRLLPQAYAAENERGAVVDTHAAIDTEDTDADTSDNSITVATYVYQPMEEQDEQPSEQQDTQSEDHRLPTLTLSAANNVSDFVYPGDTVSFELKIRNESDVASYNTRVSHKLYTERGEFLGNLEYSLGTVEPGKGGTLSFGLVIPNSGTARNGVYRTISVVSGYGPGGEQVSSPEAVTEFNVHVKPVTLVPTVEAQEPAEVLGVSTSDPVCDDQPVDEKDVLPYILLFLISSYMLIRRMRLWLEDMK